MSRLDATAQAFVEANRVIRPVVFVWMDFVGDPVRANDSGMTITLSGLDDADLNGTYDGVTGEFAQLSPVRVGAGGSDSVTARLSGIRELDDATLDIIGDEAKWKGRLCKIARAVWNQHNVQQGQIEHYYTGYMTDCFIGGSIREQFIEVTVESYLAAYINASNRTYDQKAFDAGDRSFEATLGLTGGGDNGHAGANVGVGGSYATGPRFGGISSGILVNRV